VLLTCVLRLITSNVNDQTAFVTLNDTLISIMIILITLSHPSLIPGSMWYAGGFKFRRSRAAMDKETKRQYESKRLVAGVLEVNRLKLPSQKS
jgi:hypothetical protein